MRCPKCQREWSDEFEFCPKCGIPIAAVQAEGDSAAAAGQAIAIKGDENIGVSGPVSGDLTIHIVKNYLAGAPKLDEAGFCEALGRYLTWLDGTCGSLTLRGIKQRDQQVLTLPLDEVYTSLTVETGSRMGEASRVDVGQLLHQGPRLVVTGAPGSGKSTILQYLTWTLAHALLSGDPEPVAARLGLSLPRDEEGRPRTERIKLPLPILVPLHAYADHLQRRGDGDDPHKATLAAFISDYLIRRQTLGLPEDFFEQLLAQGQNCLILLDGLDEVPDEKTRVRVSRAVEDLSHATRRNQFVVTSRPAAYTGQAVLGANFRTVRLQPMSAEQVARLVTRLYQAAIADEAERAEETAALLRAIDNLERLRARQGASERFITSPLLVRMIVIVHFSRRKLPEQRAELYREVVDVLLAASYHPDVSVAQALAEIGGGLSRQRNLLGVLAFQMHSKGEGTRLIGEQEMEKRLAEYLAPQEGPARAGEIVAEFVTSARQRGSFLDERSGQYQFLHLSFQEFLAARHLAEAVRDVDAMAAFLEEGRLADPWWREPALLLIGYLSNSSPDVAAALARRLARLPAPGQADPGWPALEGPERLAGAALAAAGMLEQPSAPPALREELARLLTGLLTAGEGPKEWAATGDTLARLGDPRPGVGLRPDGLPDMAWRQAPAGELRMGTDAAAIPDLQKRYGGDRSWYEWETPQHTVRLAGYYVARYPVTAAQYSAFVEEGGYAEQRYWTEAGWAWREREGITGPKSYGSPFDLPNHPAVGVSWYEAVTFCRWLNERFSILDFESWIGDPSLHPDQTRAEGNPKSAIQNPNSSRWAARLPTEAEWERAARGDDGRQYPWGDGWDARRCNAYETRIGATSSVGLFPAGASPYDAMDMSGNVWEWCQSLYRPYPYRAGDSREELQAEGRRVLRGGSWDLNQSGARCAFRFHDGPDFRDPYVGFRVVVAPGSLGSGF